MSIQAAIDILTNERQSKAARIVALQAEIKSESEAISGIDEALRQLGVKSPSIFDEMFNDAFHPPQTLRDLIVEVIAEAKRGLKAPDIRALVKLKGKDAPENSTYSTLSRLKQEGTIQKGADGLWYPVPFSPIVVTPIQGTATVVEGAQRALPNQPKTLDDELSEIMFGGSNEKGSPAKDDPETRDKQGGSDLV